MRLFTRLTTICLLMLIAQAAHAAEDVLIVGDSHSTGYFGSTLYDNIANSTPTKLKVRLIAKVGAQSIHYLKTTKPVSSMVLACAPEETCSPRAAHPGTSVPNISTLLTPAPKVVVVELGSNMLITNDMMSTWGHKVGAAGAAKARAQQERKLAGDVSQMITRIKDAGSKCVWIGPPQPATYITPPSDYEHYVVKLREQVESEGCRFVDSSTVTNRDNLPPRRESIGFHYDPAHATRWAGAIKDKVNEDVRQALAESRAAKTEGPNAGTRE